MTTSERLADLAARGYQWQNWGENQKVSPNYFAQPSTQDELITLIRAAIAEGEPIRVAGTGHSSSPLVHTGGLLVSLQHLQGIVGTDVERRRVRLLAGTQIFNIGDPLWEAGLALSNQGDIDKQSMAGAVATGTHGSGSTLTSFSGAVRWMKLLTGTGDIIEIGEDQPELLRAAQVSLGSLGVVLELELAVSPRYHLKEANSSPHIDELIEPGAWAANPDAWRHFSFLWCPTAGGAAMFELPAPAGLDMTERAYTKRYVEASGITEPDGLSDASGHRIDRSYRIYPEGFGIIFNEMEHFVPVEQGREAFLALRELITTKYPHEEYPVEVRWVAQDDAYLSQQYQRSNCVITTTVTPGTDYWRYLRDVDDVLQQFDARMHWGKMHLTTRERMERMYPELDRFIDIRRQLDPCGLFLNDHLRPLLT
ncbi:MAG TPA: D-arabinono-1,4-lactone oxidase [Candidatus Lumbricidophila sp.]|nr:D-arabinono-1,4-lactone oxidase [Candidatus Lumbricidophila sp.]